MPSKFINGDAVQFDTIEYGKGKGKIVGFYKTGDKIVWAVYPKLPVKNHDFMCIVVDEDKLISTPF